MNIVVITIVVLFAVLALFVLLPVSMKKVLDKILGKDDTK